MLSIIIKSDNINIEITDQAQVLQIEGEDFVDPQRKEADVCEVLKNLTEALKNMPTKGCSCTA